MLVETRPRVFVIGVGASVCELQPYSIPDSFEGIPVELERNRLPFSLFICTFWNTRYGNGKGYFPQLIRMQWCDGFCAASQFAITGAVRSGRVIANSDALTPTTHVVGMITLSGKQIG
jgi:hypothetical protein